MINDFLKYLPYILPTRTPITSDKVLEITSRHFKIMYGNTILELLWHIGALTQSEKYVKKARLKDIVKQITDLIEYSSNSNHFVWEKNGTLKIMPVTGMKPDGMETYLKQKLEGTINPSDFMIEADKESGFNDKCIVGMTFKVLLILFEKLLSQVQKIKQNNEFNLNVLILFNIVDATKQADRFCHTFFVRRPYARGANKSAKLVQETKQIVAQAVKNLNIPSGKALYSETSTKVKTEFKKISGEDFPYSDETLQKYIIEFAGH